MRENKKANVEKNSTRCMKCKQSLGVSYWMFHNEPAGTNNRYCSNCVVWSVEHDIDGMIDKMAEKLSKCMKEMKV